MTIYGTAALSLCLLAGLWLGKLLGRLAGLDIDVGGVGLAMLLLVFVTDWMRRRALLPPAAEHGIRYWGSLYIPIVVAMAASQNVHAAVQGGAVPLAAGALGVAACFALVPVVTRLSGPKPPPLPPAPPSDHG